MQPDSKSQSQYAAYWAAFGAFHEERTAPIRVREPRPITWSLNFPRGPPGASLLASAARGANRVSAIASEIGQKLERPRRDEYIASRIAIATKAFIVSDRKQWPKQFARLGHETLARLRTQAA
jgi:hypothetical protein